MVAIKDVKGEIKSPRPKRSAKGSIIHLLKMMQYIREIPIAIPLENPTKKKPFFGIGNKAIRFAIGTIVAAKKCQFVLKILCANTSKNELPLEDPNDSNSMIGRSTPQKKMLILKRGLYEL